MISEVRGHVADSDASVFISRSELVRDAMVGDFVFAVLSVLARDRFSLIMREWIEHRVMRVG